MAAGARGRGGWGCGGAGGGRGVKGVSEGARSRTRTRVERGTVTDHGLPTWFEATSARGSELLLSLAGSGRSAEASYGTETRMAMSPTFRSRSGCATLRAERRSARSCDDYVARHCTVAARSRKCLRGALFTFRLTAASRGRNCCTVLSLHEAGKHPRTQLQEHCTVLHEAGNISANSNSCSAAQCCCSKVCACISGLVQPTRRIARSL